MFSPVSQPSHSPFTSLRNSQTQLSSYTHTRTNSTSKPPSVVSHQHEPHRIPSHKKLSLTFQAQQFHNTKPSKEVETEGKRQVLAPVAANNRPISLHGSHNDQSAKSGMEQQLMIYFQQQLENLKRQYLLSLRDYENRIDGLQQQLFNNSQEIQQKTIQINKLEAVLQESKLKEKQKEKQIDCQLHLKVQDLQKRLSIIAEFAQDSRLDIQERSEKLTKNIIRCFGNRLSALRNKQVDFIQIAVQKLAAVEVRLESREKHDQSIGTRGSMESVQQVFQGKIVVRDQGASFWDDCFFYPGERSQNCSLLAQMYSRRGQPLNCWIDTQGFLRYCDSGSFLFNRRGERMAVAYNQLEWLRDQGMVRIY